MVKLLNSSKLLKIINELVKVIQEKTLVGWELIVLQKLLIMNYMKKLLMKL